MPAKLMLPLLLVLGYASACAAARAWPSTLWRWRTDPQKFVTATLKIPKILHQIHMDGYDAYVEGTQQQPPVNVAAWRDSCLLQHPDYKAMFWDADSSYDLLAANYRWFLPTWVAYKSAIARADAIRPFILHRYGGLYLDLDTQCFQSGTRFLTGYDIVLQGSSGWWDQGVINCAMASVPGHPLWMEYASSLPSRQGANDTLDETGPRALANAVAAQFGTELPLHSGLHAGDNNTVLQLYPAGQWYLACLPPKDEPGCSRALIRMLVTGELPLRTLAGHHRFHGTWYSRPHEDLLWEDLTGVRLQRERDQWAAEQMRTRRESGGWGDQQQMWGGRQRAGRLRPEGRTRPFGAAWHGDQSSGSRVRDANARRSNQVPYDPEASHRGHGGAHTGDWDEHPSERSQAQSANARRSGQVPFKEPSDTTSGMQQPDRLRQVPHGARAQTVGPHRHKGPRRHTRPARNQVQFIEDPVVRPS